MNKSLITNEFLMDIYLLYAFVSLLFFVVTFMAFYFRFALRRLSENIIDLMHHANIQSYDLARFICEWTEQKAKTNNLNETEQDIRHKSRDIIYKFEQKYKRHETYDENISSSTESAS